MAARRFMIKHFIQDLYANWRKIQGLSVRKPYEEEYLGKIHHTKSNEVSLCAKGSIKKVNRKIVMK